MRRPDGHDRPPVTPGKALLRLVAAACLAAAVLVAPVRAQTNGGIGGRIVDKDGAPIPGAIVTVSSPAIGIARGAVTDTRGEFRVVPLPSSGKYTVKVEFPGMATVVLSEIEVTGGTLSSVAVTLWPSENVREEIRVVGRTDVVNPAEPSTRTSFTSEFIDALPILGRNYQDVLTLAPGVSDIDGDGNPNIHGARDTDVVTLVDGVSTVDPYTGQRGQELNLDSIQEIEIKTSGASAEFGRAQGGFVNIVTKSGGNDFEGEFSLLWRSHILDGDGAGIDDPRTHGGLGEIGLRDLSFTDFEPFVSVSGPILKDRAWFYFTAEYRQIQEPVNALTQAFVRGEEEFRVFGKATWDMSINHKIQFTVTLDPQEYTNQELDSYTAIEAGATETLGGLNLVLKETAIFSPNVFLETTVQHFTSRPGTRPTTDPDTNGNGVLFKEQRVDGFYDGRERDPGEDLDRDIDAEGRPSPRWDVFEDSNHNGLPDPGEDIDGDGRLTNGDLGPWIGQCEGETREDVDCDGRLDRVNEDTNANGLLDPGEDRDSDRRLDAIEEDRDGDGQIDFEDRNGNGIHDPGEPTEDGNGNGILDAGDYIEDRNFNGILDDRPWPAADDIVYHVALDGTRTALAPYYPYARFQPLTHDRDYTFDLRTGRFFGPYRDTIDREVGRITLREDLTVYIPEWHGQHDMKFGGVVEQERFDQVLYRRPWILDNPRAAISIEIPSEYGVPNEAVAKNIGLYINDVFKPRPNLTFGVGVRFDRETTDSYGFSPFDPVAERQLFDRLWNLGGGERRAIDALSGNNDGLLSQGFCDDPIFSGPEAGDVCGTWRYTETFPIVAEFNSLRRIAPSRLTQHHVGTALAAATLSNMFPEAVVIDPITGQEIIDRELLRERGSATFQEREAFRLTNHNLAPRLHVAWDPWADAKTKIYAGWGRYFDKLFLNTVTVEEGPDTISRTYRASPYFVTATGLPTNGFGVPISLAPPSPSQVDRGLQTPFVDEFTLGFERELAPEVALRLTFIDRKFRQQLQDTDINHSLRYNKDTGQALDTLGDFLEIPPGPGQVAPRVADGYPDLYIHNFFMNQVYRLGNVNEARYRALEVQLTRRLSRKWQLDASYTYSRARGHAEDFLSDLGDDPATVSTEYSYLEYDERHVVKLNLATYLPRDWIVGGAMQWSSGLPYSRISFFTAADNFDYYQVRRLFGYIPEPTEDPDGVFKIVRRNSDRNEPYLLLDLRAEKAFVMGRLASTFFLTVDNVLNSDVLRIFSYDPSAPNRGGRLQLDAERGFGRRFQIGLSIDF